MFGMKARREAAIVSACASGSHERDSRGVSHEGGKLTAPCLHCGTTLTRTVTGWRAAPPTEFPQSPILSSAA